MVNSSRPDGIHGRWRHATSAERFIVALLLLFAIKQVSSVLLFPPFTGHDEVAHYAYTRTVATEHRVPVIPDLAEWRSAFAAQQVRPGDFLPVDLYRYCRYVLDWNFCEEPAWANNPPVAVTLAGQIYPHGWQYAANHPPLFYMIMAPIYLATDHFSPSQQQYVMRAATIPIGMAVVLLTFLIARLLFPRDQFIQVVAPSFVAFQTQISYEGAMINNDILLIFMFTLLLYLLVRGLRQGFTLGSASVIGLVLGLGLLSKATMMSALPVVAVVMIVAIGIRRPKRWIPLGAVSAIVAGLIAAPWYIFLYRTYGNFSALPQVKALQYSHTYRGQTPPTVLEQLLNRDFAKMRWSESWGEFGWRLIPLPQWILTLIGIPLLLIAIASLAGLVWGTIRLFRGQTGPGIASVGRIPLFGLWTMLLVCLIAYGAMLQFGTQFSLTQARYFFNAIAPVAILLAFGLRLLTPARARPGVAVAFLVFMIGINILIYSQAVLPFWYLPS